MKNGSIYISFSS